MRQVFQVMSKANVSLSGGFAGRNRTVMTLENNSGPGLSLTGASQCYTSTDPMQSAITLAMRNNGGSDMAVDDASVTLQNPRGTNILGNVALTFGARATLNGNTIGRITCDRTVLLRGNTGVVCPSP